MRPPSGRWMPPSAAAPDPGWPTPPPVRPAPGATFFLDDTANLAARTWCLVRAVGTGVEPPPGESCNLAAGALPRPCLAVPLAAWDWRERRLALRWFFDRDQRGPADSRPRCRAAGSSPARSTAGALAGEKIALAARRRRRFRGATVAMRHCIYPGTFDPITYGHLDVLSRAARLFDRVTVAVAETAGAGKAPTFTAEQRVAMIAPNLSTLPNVGITTFRGLLVEFCMAQQADAIIRGLRVLSDFEFEFNMALMNRHLEPRMETLFVMPNEEYSYTSSTLVKQVARFGGDVARFVPPNVAEALRAAYASQPV